MGYSSQIDKGHSTSTSGSKTSGGGYYTSGKGGSNTNKSSSKAVRFKALIYLGQNYWGGYDPIREKLKY